MKILVTGGAGCIGSDLCEALVAQGHNVRAIDNFSSGKRDHIENLLKSSLFEFVGGDLTDFEVVKQAVDGMDFVYHLAANPDVKFVEGEPTDKDLRQNTICTYHVLDAMRHHGVKKLAFSSTSAVY